MGQEIHRKGLITKTEVDGLNVIAFLDMDDDEDFGMAMLEKHLQMNYPESEIVENLAYNIYQSMVTIRFATLEDALHFHLSH